MASSAADPGEEAIRRGIDFRRQGQDDQALAEFKKAYTFSPSPRALAQIGLAEQALGLWVDAETHLRVALESSTDPWIKKNGAILQSALEAIDKHLGSVQILGTPVGAEVLIQGNSVGRLPMASPTRFPIGDAQVEVRHPGFRTISRIITVSAGELSRETITLVPPVPQDQTRSPNGLPETTVNRAAASAHQDRPVEWRRPVTWAVAGVGIVGIGVGVIETLVAVQKSKDFNRLPDNCMDGGNGLILGGDRCVQADHDQTVATWTAALGYSLGGLLVATAVVLHLTEPSPSSQPRQTARPSCGPGVTSTGIACTVHW